VEKDLWVLVDNKLSISQWHALVPRKANSILGYISRSTDSRSRDVIILLYSGLIRPHLEYHIQVWIHHYKQEINKLE